MSGRSTLVVIVLTLVVVVGIGLVIGIAAGSTNTPGESSAGLATAAPSPSPSPVANPSAPAQAAAPADPCHRNGVTYCVLNPSVTEATIRSTICVSGWTATIRPPTGYTEPLKLQQMALEGLGGSPSNYEEDHRMPLELGGDPRDPSNLSPESHSTSYAKDAAENSARRQVCDGADLRTVQATFVSTWLAPYPAYAK